VPRYVTGFVVDDILTAHQMFEKVLLHARALGPQAKGTVVLIESAYRLFNADLNELARVSAIDAEKKMREQLRKTAKRPDTGIAPHLRSALKARPIRTVGRLGTGVVGVADKNALEKVTSPVDGFAYWKVQEEGTRANVGRTIRGYFFDRGYANPTRPAPGYTGTPAAQPIFRPGRLGNLPRSVSGGIGPQGGQGGKGVIRNPIAARHFIRDGAARAHVDWLAGLRAVEVTALANLRAAIRPGPARRVRRARRR
jgi:hypothetical protein